MTRRTGPEHEKVFFFNRKAHHRPSSIRITQGAPHGGELDYTPILGVRVFFFDYVNLI